MNAVTKSDGACDSITTNAHLVLFSKGHYGNYHDDRHLFALRVLVGELMNISPAAVTEVNLIHLLGRAVMEYAPTAMRDVLEVLEKSHRKFLRQDPVGGLLGILCAIKVREGEQVLVELPNPDPKLQALIKEKIQTHHGRSR